MVLTWGCKYITIYQSIYLIFLFRPYAEFFTCSIQVDLLAILGDSIIIIPNVDSKKVKKKKKKMTPEDEAPRSECVHYATGEV